MFAYLTRSQTASQAPRCGVLAFHPHSPPHIPLDLRPSRARQYRPFVPPNQSGHPMSAKLVIGVPTEIKTDVYRVAMMQVGVEVLRRVGHCVLIKMGAGKGG